MESYKAAQANQNAGQANAAAQRTAQQQQRVAGFAESTANADAAASGADTLSPSVVSDEQNIAGQGTFNAMTALYQGKAKAAGDTQEALTDQYQGGLDQSEANTKALTTLASSGSSMLMKYGSPFQSSSSYAPGGTNNPVNASGDSTMDPEFAQQYGFQ